MADKNLKWIQSIRDTKQLRVCAAAADSWSAEVEAAIRDFNNLSFGVAMEVTKSKDDADIAIIVTKNDTFNWKGTDFKSPSFAKGSVHGSSQPVCKNATQGILFSCIFFPGSSKKLKTSQKRVIALHELIHSAGMREHDIEGVMCAGLTKQGNGLIEILLPSRDVKPMPPIRIGAKTLSTVRSLWE